MNIEVAQERLKAALKQVLKKRSFTYSDVAKVWDCSTPTVKRLLGPEEMPLSRLLSLLDWLDLSLSDLQKLADSDTLDEPRYTAKQNEFLAKTPAAFALLMKLYGDETPQVIAKTCGVPQAVMDRLLIQLEKHDLIRVGAGGKVKPAWPRPPRLEGELGNAHFRNILDRFNMYFKYQIGRQLSLRKEERGHSHIAGGTFELRESTFKIFQERLQKIIEDMAATSKAESHQFKTSELRTSVCLLSYGLDDGASDDLRLVRDIFSDMLSNESRK